MKPVTFPNTSPSIDLPTFHCGLIPYSREGNKNLNESEYKAKTIKRCNDKLLQAETAFSNGESICACYHCEQVMDLCCNDSGEIELISTYIRAVQLYVTALQNMGYIKAALGMLFEIRDRFNRIEPDSCPSIILETIEILLPQSQIKDISLNETEILKDENEEEKEDKNINNNKKKNNYDNNNNNNNNKKKKKNMNFNNTKRSRNDTSEHSSSEDDGNVLTSYNNIYKSKEDIHYELLASGNFGGVWGRGVDTVHKRRGFNINLVEKVRKCERKRCTKGSAKKKCKIACALQKGKNTVKALKNREISGYGFTSTGRRSMAQFFLPDMLPYTIDKYPSRAYSCQFNHNGDLLYTTNQNWDISFYSVKKHGEIFTKKKTLRALFGRWTLTDTCLSEDNSLLAYSTIYPAIIIANINELMSINYEADVPCSKEITQETIHLSHDPLSVSNPDFAVWSLAMSGNGSEILAGTSNHLVYAVDVETKKITYSAHGHSDDVNSVAYCNFNKGWDTFITGSDDSLMYIWDKRMTYKKPVGAFVGHTEGITHVEPKGDGKYFLSNSKDQKMKLWDIRTLTCRINKQPRKYKWDYRGMQYPGNPKKDIHPDDSSVVTFIGHKVLKTLIKCRFSPMEYTGQRYVYTGSTDGFIYIFDLSGNIVRKLDLCESNGCPLSKKIRKRDVVRDVTWHPTFPTLIASVFDGRIVKFSR